MIYDNYMQSSSNGFSHSHSHGHSQSMYPNNNNGQYNRFENVSILTIIILLIKYINLIFIF